MRTFGKALAVTLATLATLVIVGVTPAQAHTPTVTRYCQYEVDAGTDGLRVRAHHDTTSTILRWMPSGTLITAGYDGTATGSGYTWRQVWYSGAHGWSATNYLRRTTAPCYV